jgi:hypothetical protein
MNFFLDFRELSALNRAVMMCVFLQLPVFHGTQLGGHRDIMVQKLTSTIVPAQLEVFAWSRYHALAPQIVMYHITHSSPLNIHNPDDTRFEKTHQNVESLEARAASSSSFLISNYAETLTTTIQGTTHLSSR